MSSFLLRYYLPAQGWQSQALAPGQYSLGSGPSNALTLADPQVAPQHAHLHLSEAGIAVYEVSAKYPVYVARQRIATGQWVRMNPGQDFSLGGVTLRVELNAAATAPVVASAAKPPPAAATRPPVIASAAKQSPAATRPSVIASAAKPSQPGQPVGVPRNNKAGLWLWLGGGLALVLCLAVFGGGALWALRSGVLALPGSGGGTTTAGGQSQPQIEPTLAPPVVLAELPVQPGQSVQDEFGAALTLPAEALTGTLQANLSVTQLQGALAQAIDAAYTVESPAYAVSAASSDGVNRPTLRIPAASPQARLAVVIDGRYFGELDIQPQNGFFEVRPYIAAPGAAGEYVNLAAQETAKQYLVVTPRDGQGRQPAGAGSFVLAAALPADLQPGLLAADGSGKSCVAERFTTNHCWRNEAQSVYIFWKKDYPASLNDTIYATMIETIGAVQGVMQFYQGKGFAAAAIDSSNRVDVVMDAAVSEPFYSPRSGNLYLPWDIVGAVAGAEGRCTLAHELFHWIQDENYPMLANYYSHARSWWLETSAENATFWMDPVCVGKNLSSYGKLETEEGMLAFQSKPLIWMGGEQARYIHAQQLYLSLCSGGANCALTYEQMVQATNAGSFPFSDGGAQSRYEAAAADLARYLLGEAPQQARSDVTLPPAVLGGRGYGDYLVFKSAASGATEAEFGFVNSQFKKINNGEVEVSARIQQGGVYPLWVGSGGGTPYVERNLTGLPAVLEIQPGPPFWLKQGSDPAKFYSGAEVVKIGAISDKLGLPPLRLAAYATSGEQTFKASLKVVDLSGDWESKVTGASVVTQACGESNDDSSSELTEAGEPILTALMGLGTFVKDPEISDGSVLQWQATEALPEGATIEASLFVHAEDVRLSYRIDVPRSSSGQALLAKLGFAGRFAGARGSMPDANPAQAAALPAALILALVAMGLLRFARSDNHNLLSLRATRLASLSLCLLAAMLLLTACFGLEMYGSISGDYTFKKIELIDPKNNPYGNEQYVYRLSDGGGRMDFDLTMVVINPETDEETESPCRIVMDLKLEAFTGADGLVPPPESD